MDDFETFPGVGFHKSFARNTFEIYGFREDLSDGESSSLVCHLAVITGISPGALDRTVGECMPLA